MAVFELSAEYNLDTKKAVKALKDLDRGFDKTSKSGKKAAKALSDIGVKSERNLGRANRSVNRVSKSLVMARRRMERFSNSFKTGLSRLKIPLVGVTAGIAGLAAGTFYMSKRFSEAYDPIIKLGKNVGTSTEFLRVLKYQMDQVVGSSEGMEKGVDLFSKRLGDLKFGKDNFFKKLPESVKAALTGIDSLDQGLVILRNYTRTLKDTEKAKSILFDAMGPFGRRLAVLFDQPDKELKNLLDSFRKYNYVLSEADKTHTEAFIDTMDNMMRSIKSIADAIAARLNPIFVSVNKKVADFAVHIRGLVESKTDQVFDRWGKAVNDFMDSFSSEDITRYFESAVKFAEQLPGHIRSAYRASVDFLNTVSTIVDKLAYVASFFDSTTDKKQPEKFMPPVKATNRGAAISNTDTTFARVQAANDYKTKDDPRLSIDSIQKNIYSLSDSIAQLNNSVGNAANKINNVKVNDVTVKKSSKDNSQIPIAP